MDYNSYTAKSCQPIQAPCSAMAVQVVPVYSPPGYEALTHGPCAYSHLNISQAYPSNCDQFIQRLCDCNCGNGAGPLPIPTPPTTVVAPPTPVVTGPTTPDSYGPTPTPMTATGQNIMESYYRYRRRR